MALDAALVWSSAAMAFIGAFLLTWVGFYLAKLLDPYTKEGFQTMVPYGGVRRRDIDEESTGLSLQDAPAKTHPGGMQSTPMPVTARQAWVVDYRSAPDDVEFEWRGGNLLVSFVLNNGFSSKRGIRVGDRVLEVDGVTVDELGGRSAQDILRTGTRDMAVKYELRLRTQDGTKLRENLAQSNIQVNGLEVTEEGDDQANWMVTFSDPAHVDCTFELKNNRQVVSFVPAGGRSQSRGIRVGDELVEANGISVSMLEKDALDMMLQQRPLKLCFCMQLGSAAVAANRVV